MIHMPLVRRGRVLSSLAIYHLANTISNEELRTQIRGAASEVLIKNAQQLR